MKSVQTDRFRFDLVFYDKNWFKLVWLGFSGLTWFFRFALIFFWFGLVFFGFGSVFSVLGL
jgi:hypothetical protein